MNGVKVKSFERAHSIDIQRVRRASDRQRQRFALISANAVTVAILLSRGLLFRRGGGVCRIQER